jgi:hypothetical protein
MGGPYSSNHQLRQRYAQAAGALKAQQKSMLLPLGGLPLGTSRHRALLFKVGWGQGACEGAEGEGAVHVVGV